MKFEDIGNVIAVDVIEKETGDEFSIGMIHKDNTNNEYAFEPSDSEWMLSAKELRQIADKLDKLNKETK